MGFGHSAQDYDQNDLVLVNSGTKFAIKDESIGMNPSPLKLEGANLPDGNYDEGAGR